MTSKKTKGMCDSCQDITEIHQATDQEWLCEACDPTPTPLTLTETNGRTYLLGLGL